MLRPKEGFKDESDSLQCRLLFIARAIVSPHRDRIVLGEVIADYVCVRTLSHRRPAGEIVAVDNNVLTLQSYLNFKSFPFIKNWRF